MASNRNFSEIDTLELYRVTLVNSRDSDPVAEALATIGYDSEKLDEGDELFAITEKAHFKCNHAKSKMKIAHMAFSKKKKAVHESFTRHRQE